MSRVLLREETFGWFLQLLLLLISAFLSPPPPPSYIVQVVVPHALDGPKHGTACYLLCRDLVDDPAGNQGVVIIIIFRKERLTAW